MSLPGSGPWCMIRAKHFVTAVTDGTFTYRRDEDKTRQDRGRGAARRAVHRPLQRRAGAVRRSTDGAGLQGPVEGGAGVSEPEVGGPERCGRSTTGGRTGCGAHVLLCMLAYYVEWHMRHALAPLLFDDDDPAAAEQQRPSVVAAARRSPAALAKAGCKQTDDDLPVHSFRTLLTDLGTLTANTMQVAESGVTFQLQTRTLMIST